MGNELYDLFKQYVIARIDKKEINIEAGLKVSIMLLLMLLLLLLLLP